MNHTDIERVGRFAIHEQLGTGGMAVVHRAVERCADGSQRTVALKRLHPHCARDESLVESFLREASITKDLDHPNVAHTFEYGPMGSGHFISMEYIEGYTVLELLRASAKSAPPPIHVTISLLRDLCAGLDYIHNKSADGRNLGLLHRDISPANLIVDTKGCLHIIDFGIAKASHAIKQTQGTTVKGKLSYLSPEALLRQVALDPRTDLFSVGIVAHELLVARPLFAGKTDVETIRRVLEDPIPPPSDFNISCPKALESLVLSALSRDRRDRCASAGEMQETLNTIGANLSITPNHEQVALWCRTALGFSSPADPQTNPNSGFVQLTPVFSQTNSETERSIPFPVLPTPTPVADVTGTHEKVAPEVRVTFRRSGSRPAQNYQGAVGTIPPPGSGHAETGEAGQDSRLLRTLLIGCVVVGLLLITIVLYGVMG